MTPRAFLAAVFAAAVSSPALAAPLAREDVPGPLAPWVRWALSGQEERLCPFLQGNPENRPCLWPGALTLSLNEKGGQFSQGARAHAEAWLALPGDGARWPQDVRVDGAAATVVLRGGVPSVRLKPGDRLVSGAFRWESLPEQLKIPAETGLLLLSVGGAAVPFPVRDEIGRLWLQRSRGPERGESHLEVAVHRKVVDEVPLQLVTQIQLKVSGKDREVLLGKALPAGFTPMSLFGPLPARLEPDSRLRVQVRPGTWQLELTARHEGPASALTLAEPDGPWDSDEAWAFDARNDLRIASVEGVPPLDPQQTELPQNWRRYPIYLMKPGSTMRLVESRRGDADPKPDRLSLSRTLWLDFDGGGLSVQDQLTGSLSRGWRLEMGERTALGRVSIGGQDQLITALRPGGPAGVEVRQGQVTLSADSRVETRAGGIPAVGWAHDFESVSARLHLPPGWKLLHAGGVDSAAPTWVARWTLLDLFLVLILSIAVGRLWGGRWGVVALAAAGLSWHEGGAPRWVWLWLIATDALARAMPEGTFGAAARTARRLFQGALILIVLPFFVSQVRLGLYPQLEHPHWRAAQEAPASPEYNANQAAPAGIVPRRARASKGAFGMAGAAMQSMDSALSEVEESGYDSRYYQKSKQFFELDPKAAVNTGPGIPSWSWLTVQLDWRGPVRRDQRLSLWLISPRAGLALSFLRVGLISVLGLLLFGLPAGEWISALRSSEGWRDFWRWLLPPLSLLLLVVPPAEAQGLPSRELIEELRNRLLERPDCAPVCAEAPRLRLEASAGVLRGRLEAHAAAPTALPLPGGGRQWAPTKVLVDGVPAGVRRSEDGTLWVALTPGAKLILFEGPLPDADSVQVPLPLRPRRVEVSAPGWTVHGLNEDGLPDDNLQLSRHTAGARSPGAALAQGVLPPFVQVRRTLRLGLSWQVETTVQRLTPTDSPITLEVPLLEGESITSAGIRTQDGKAQVVLGPQAASASWASVLSEAKSLALKAPDAVPWVEVWRLEAGPVWHVEAKGIPTIHQEPQAGGRIREWRPWPGESVSLSITRPEALPGQTLTIDGTVLSVSPGLRATDATLTLSLRSSRGVQHPVTLPDGAELQSARIDGALQPLRQEGRKVVLPVQPGSHTAELVWREPRGIKAFFSVPEPGAGAPSVNASVSLAMPERRWTLFVGGPPLGPAVLFWSLLAVFALASLALGRLPWTPLRWTQWFLLSVGLTQIPIAASALVAFWLVALGLRGEKPSESADRFNLLQLALAALTFVALGCLFGSIKKGLLGLPDMQIGGNGSSAGLLQWYQDRSGETLPGAWVISAPLFVYRLAMLAWALWLAQALLGWLRWGWGCFSKDGLWKQRPPKILPPPPPAK